MTTRKVYFSKMKYLIYIQIAILCVLLFGMGAAAFFILWQQPARELPPEPITIGIIQYLDLLNPVANGFQDGMKELGYVEGENVIYQFESSEGDKQRIAQITASYIAQDVDLIYTITSVAAREALAETLRQQRNDVPIVYAHADNPVATGLAQNLKSSGNHATGVAVDLKELTGKKLEFLQAIDPNIKRLGVFTATHTDPAAELALAELRSQLSKFDMELIEYHLKNPPGASSTKELAEIANQIQPGDIHALFQTPGPVINQQENVELFVALGKRLRIPTVFTSTPQVGQGGLFAYSQDFFQIGKQSAHIAQKVLRGTPPHQIPIEIPQDNVLAINFETARQIGISIPEPMLTLVTVEFGR